MVRPVNTRVGCSRKSRTLIGVIWGYLLPQVDILHVHIASDAHDAVFGELDSAVGSSAYLNFVEFVRDHRD